MRIFFWIVFLPITLLVIIFAVNNRQDIILDVWPLMVTVPPLPLYIIAIVMVFVGFIWGGIVAWIGAGRSRRRARELSRQVEADRHHIAVLNERMRKLEASREPTTRSLSPPANAA